MTTGQFLQLLYDWGRVRNHEANDIDSGKVALSQGRERQCEEPKEEVEFVQVGRVGIILYMFFLAYTSTNRPFPACCQYNIKNKDLTSPPPSWSRLM